MSKSLQLSLKTEWFEMTKSGIKTEDYRELTDYWFRRLVDSHSYLSLEYFMKVVHQIKGNAFKQFDSNIMTLGYPKSTDKDRIIKFEHAGIEIRTGREEWGAEPGKLYFVIKHGKQL